MFSCLQKLPYSVLFITIFICLYGCTRESSRSKQEPVRIGVLCPFTGKDASTGEDIKAGIELAVDIINNGYDLPIPLAQATGLPLHGNARVQIVYKDTEGDPQKAADFVDKLVAEDRVAAIMGCYSSTVTAAASERAEILKIPFLNAASTSPTLTQRGFKWFFRTTPDDEIFAENFFTFLAELSEKKKIEANKKVILVYENRLWGTSVSRAERKMALKHDYQIAGDVPYDAGARSFTSELQGIKTALPGIILQASYEQDAILLLQGYKRSNIAPAAILGMDAGFISPSFLTTLGPDAEYVLSREVWALDLGSSKPLVKTVNALFRKQFGRDMTGNSARTFTGLIVLADALNRARTLEPQKIREALLGTDITSEQLIMPWSGVKFDPATGQNILGKGIIVQVQQGKYRTVWPWELADLPVIWPMPSWAERDKKQ